MLISALYSFEWLVTLDQEVKYIWTTKWTLSTWIFAVNRYASLVYAVGLVSPTLTPNVLFSGLRAFALTSRNVWLFLMVFALNMVPFATNMVISISTRGCVILADVIVLVVTWTKAFGTVREASRLKIKVPLSEILIRDGNVRRVGGSSSLGRAVVQKRNGTALYCPDARQRVRVRSTRDS
ncbi:hypothetical protein BC835DRAFT_1290468 [Cytidiella melzeri]|nr:hypothetical protein BC835DRAFT_1290468 [Cytidiella melzeri]